MKNIFLSLLFVFQLIFASNGFACNVINNQSSNLKIVFVNGIANTIDDACSSMKNLATLVGNTNYNYSYFYNTQDPNGVDQVELTWQATQSNLALSANGYYASEIAGDASKKFNYYKTLGERYKNAVNAPGSVLQIVNRLVNRIKSELQTSTNKKLVLVAHSQGNFYVEAAYAMLLNEASTNGDASIVNLLQRLRIVGAASVAASTPHNRYLSHSNDLAVFVGQAAIISLTSSYTNYKPLKHNAIACVFSPCTDQEGKTLASLYYVAQLPEGGNDTALHNFQAVYLNQSFFSEATGKSFSSIIVEMIKGSINELNPPTATISIITPSPLAGSGVVFQPNITTSPNGEITDYEWDFGDGTITRGTASQISHIYTAGGSYPVILKIKDAAGVTNTTTTTVTVSGIPSPIVASINPKTATTGELTTFTIAGTNLPTANALNVSFNGCANITFTMTTENLHRFTCTPQSAFITITAFVRATAGGTVLKSQEVVVSAAVTAYPTPPANARYAALGSYPITSCVKDKTTGLIWEGKEDTGVRDGHILYTNFGDFRVGDSSAYLRYVNSISLCGFNDWRMPTVNELKSSMDTTNVNLYLNQSWFPNNFGNIIYWGESSGTLYGNPSAYVVAFVPFVVGWYGNTYDFYVGAGYAVRLIH